MYEKVSDHLLNLKIPITTIHSGKIPPGYYEFPFKCTLPAKWPLSFHIKNTITTLSTYGNFGIRYTISVCIKYRSPQSSTIIDCLATESLIIAGRAVAEPPNESSTYTVIEPEFVPVQVCCYKKGSMLLGFDTSNTLMAPNAVVDIGILGKNSSVVNVQYLLAQLVQTIRWTAYVPTHINRTVIAQTIIGASPAWDPLGKSTFERDDYKHSLPTFSEIEASRVQGCLRVPCDALESYQGQIIQITYALLITAVTSGNIFVTSPQSAVSVQVEQNASFDSNIDTHDDVEQSTKIDNHDFPTAMVHVMPDSLTPHVADCYQRHPIHKMN